jgi:hypothetical protein
MGHNGWVPHLDCEYQDIGREPRVDRRAIMMSNNATIPTQTFVLTMPYERPALGVQEEYQEDKQFD